MILGKSVIFLRKFCVVIYKPGLYLFPSDVVKKLLEPDAGLVLP